MYYNYKGFFSIILLGIVDADYRYIWLQTSPQVGAQGLSTQSQEVLLHHFPGSSRNGLQIHLDRQGGKRSVVSTNLGHWHLCTQLKEVILYHFPGSSRCRVQVFLGRHGGKRVSILQHSLQQLRPLF